MASFGAICAALAIAPSLADAKTQLYEGPIDLAKNPGFVTGPDGEMVGPFRTYTPTIQLKVAITGRREVEFGGQVTVLPAQTNVEVKAFGLYGPCSGRGVSDGETKYDSGGYVRVRKNGRFSFTDSEQGFITIRGRIPAKGTSTGTVRTVTQSPFDPASNGYDPTYGTCDSGVRSWRATKTNRLSNIEDL